jgi:hypothetical protein
MIGTILLVFAFVLATIAVFVGPYVAAPSFRYHLGWAAMACYFLSLLLGSFGGSVAWHR